MFVYSFALFWGALNPSLCWRPHRHLCHYLFGSALRSLRQAQGIRISAPLPLATPINTSTVDAYGALHPAGTSSTHALGHWPGSILFIYCGQVAGARRPGCTTWCAGLGLAAGRLHATTNETRSELQKQRPALLICSSSSPGRGSWCNPPLSPCACFAGLPDLCCHPR